MRPALLPARPPDRGAAARRDAGPAGWRRLFGWLALAGCCCLPPGGCSARLVGAAGERRPQRHQHGIIVALFGGGHAVVRPARLDAAAAGAPARPGAGYRTTWPRAARTWRRQLLAERSHGPHETAWWFAAVAIKLGLLGTVVGFIVMATQIGQHAELRPRQVQTCSSR
jgi:hypothetical protein